MATKDEILVPMEQCNVIDICGENCVYLNPEGEICIECMLEFTEYYRKYGNAELTIPEELHEHKIVSVKCGDDFILALSETGELFCLSRLVSCRIQNAILGSKLPPIKYINCDSDNAMGHSNGGVFACLLPIYMPNDFKAIISHQGGFGYDEWFHIPFDNLSINDKKTPIYFYTGTEDIHMMPCIQAHRLFTNEGFASTLYIEPGLTHTWDTSCETRLYTWMQECV